ncbi:hypothetical protein GAY31_11400 [Azospirillum brasilense]|nr:hypothetical protein [Azospirillum brasilense]
MTDVTPNGLSVEQAQNAFLKLATDDESLSTAVEEAQEPVEATNDEALEHDENETAPEDTDDHDVDEDGEKPIPNSADEQEVDIQVGEETKKVKIKDLKRLYGQEAALTQKSQQVAALRKQVETDGAKHAAALERLHQKAEAKWSQYASIDWHTLGLQMQDNPQAFAALRQEATEAYKEFQFITGELDQFVTDLNAKQTHLMQQQAVEAVKVLKKEIPDWTPERYDAIRLFGIQSGLDANMVNNLVDPAAIILIDKARQFDAMQAKAQNKIADVKKKTAQPSRVLKPDVAPSNKLGNDPARKAMDALRRTGSKDAAMNAFKSLRRED